jgi:Na+/H+ antiporter NhaD/arsenite permease-like protein
MGRPKTVLGIREGVCMVIPLIVLTVVFALIAIRRVGNIKLQIWQIMLLGAIAVLITAQISPADAIKSIDLDVMLFLFGMFIVGQAMEESGYLSHLSYNMFKRARSTDSLILLILFGMGIASAFLMNDTVAIIGTPVVLLLAKKHDVSPKLLLLALAFAVTIGSAMSPIGNPQNILIAINGGVPNPFITFFKFPPVANDHEPFYSLSTAEALLQEGVSLEAVVSFSGTNKGSQTCDPFQALLVFDCNVGDS